MQTTTLFGTFLRYVSLNLFGQAAYACYTLADTFFVSARLGADGLTALNLAFPVFCLISGAGLMTGMGGGTRYALARSRQDASEANRSFTCACLLTLTASLLFVLVGLFGSQPLARALGADETMFALTHTYLRVMLLFAPAFLANHLMLCFVRNDGAPALASAALITGSLSNVILDYLFIFPLDLGILGAILATGLAPVISLCILSTHILRGRCHFHLSRGALRLHRLRPLLACGVPPLVTELSSGIVMFLFNFILLRLAGNLAVAAFGIVSVISLVVTALFTGLSQGMQPLLSLHHGAGDARSVTRLRIYAAGTALVLAMLLYGGIACAAQPLARLFNHAHDPQLQMLAVRGLRLYFLACPFLGWNLVSTTYLASTERTRPAQGISLARGLLVLIPMAFLLAAQFGLDGVWCAYPATECVVAVLAAVLSRTPKP